MTPPLSSLLLVGCGNMGRALLERWQHASGIAHFDIIEPHHAQAASPRVTWYQKLEALPSENTPDIIVFAVKPQQLAELLPAYKTRFGARPLYISIAAGKSLDFFCRYLGRDAHVVRVMPNTPALIGEGMSVLCAPGLPPPQRQTAGMLMQAAGKIAWVEDEALMDAVTAISGSGPAYLFYFLECLTQAGMSAGLSAELARTLALETICGSATLAKHSSEHFEQLRKNVTSPGGTTEAALSVLMQRDGLASLLQNAVAAAKKRSGELKE